MRRVAFVLMAVLAVLPAGADIFRPAPPSSSGGGGGGAGTPDFPAPDQTSTFCDTTFPTKCFRFETSAITSGVTHVINIQNGNNGSLALLGLVQPQATDFMLATGNNFSWGGGATEPALAFKTQPTPDGPFLYTGTLSNSWQIAERGDATFAFNNGPCGTSACTYPTLILNSDGATTTDWMAFWQDGTDAFIDNASGGSVVISDPLRLGATSGAANSIDANTVAGCFTFEGTAADGNEFNLCGGVLAADATLNVAALVGGAAVASAAAITPAGSVFHVTGTTGITSITSTNYAAGACTMLIFDGVVTVTDGSNLKLAGDFTSSADDTLSLCYDGTNWYERSRSLN